VNLPRKDIGGLLRKLVFINDNKPVTVPCWAVPTVVIESVGFFQPEITWRGSFIQGMAMLQSISSPHVLVVIVDLKIDRALG
jgi:hypothetical protein